MKKTSGFTTMELVIVIAIIGVIASIAIPNLITWRSSNQLRGSARELQAAINGARLTAIKENALVTVTFDPAAGQIETTFTNRATGVARPPVVTQVKPGVQIVSTTFTDDGFRFNSRGLPINIANTNFASGTVRLSNASGDPLEVIMTSTGNTRIAVP